MFTTRDGQPLDGCRLTAMNTYSHVIEQSQAQELGALLWAERKA